MEAARKPIGIFDSGVGGLTVLKAVRERLPAEQLIYLGDTARLPYGTKSPSTVQRYALHAAEHLLRRDIKLLVVACNTATALALPLLQQQLAPIPVLGVVQPGAAAAVQQSRNGRYLVLATEATARQQAYSNAIHALSPNAAVQELACAMFVALAEEGWHAGGVAESVATKYLQFVAGLPGDETPDTAILGCTHFPLLRKPISAVLGPDVSIVDSASTTAAAVEAELLRLELLATEARSDALQLIATDGAARFARVGSLFLGQRFSAADIELVDMHPQDLPERD